MANEESSQKQGENLSSVTYFVEKLATVFSRVKDCVLQDLLDELIKEGATWEDFQKELDQVKDNSIDKNIDDFKVFVDRIVKKLGYDISAAKAECGELYNVLAQLVVSGEKLGVAFKKLFKEYEDKDPQKVLEDLISGIKVTPNESKDGKNATLVTWSDVKESFEEELGDWTTIDADGDGQTWYGLTTAQGAFTPHDGEAFMTSASYQNAALTPDNYLVSPKVKLGGSITFWACAQDASWAAEHFGVAVSTTGNTDAADFTTIEEWTMTSAGTPASSRRKVQGTWGEPLHHRRS